MLIWERDQVLEIQSVCASYDEAPVLTEVSISVGAAEVVSILGSNGAGKSTLIRVISGLMHPSSGSIRFEGSEINDMAPHEIVKRGIVQIPEGRRIFGRLNVLENLRLGGYVVKSEEETAANLAEVFNLFPVLRERQEQPAGTLSGGQQQMLAIGRGLMASPKVLILDEPSLGLMPKLVQQIFSIVRQIHERGIAGLLVEQNVREALMVANRAYVLQTGKIVADGPSEMLLKSDLVRKAYLGM